MRTGSWTIHRDFFWVLALSDYCLLYDLLSITHTLTPFFLLWRKNPQKKSSVQSAKMWTRTKKE